MTTDNFVQPTSKITPDELTRRGEETYFNDLKDKLEKSNNGEFVVIEVESKDYFVDKDLMVALEKAKAKYKDKLFFIVQIGSLQRQALNYKQEQHGWLF